MTDEINNYGLGWAFFKNCGVDGGCFLPLETDNLTDWVKGFMAAQADYINQDEYISIEAALISNGVKGKILEKLLDAAETALKTPGEWFRVPSVPLRGRAKSNADLHLVQEV